MPKLALEEFSKRLARLENTVLDRAACTASYPSLHESDSFEYSGCNRNVHRNSTRSVETCQNGTLTIYNVSTTSTTGLFDVRIAANVPTHDAWDFVCVLTRDQPHRATCTLTFETPKRPEGPAWVALTFRKVARCGAPHADACCAAQATIVGTYFYDALTNDAGVYAFYASARGGSTGNASEAFDSSHSREPARTGTGSLVW